MCQVSIGEMEVQEMLVGKKVYKLEKVEEEMVRQVADEEYSWQTMD
jgi:hypothetical protein